MKVSRDRLWVQMLKNRLTVRQGGRCRMCSKVISVEHAVLDRLDGIGNFTPENTRLVHAQCEMLVRRRRAARGRRHASDGEAAE